MKTPIPPQTDPELATARIIERPDGFYWRARGGGREYGPFPSYVAALEDAEAGTLDEDESIEPEESLEEAEAEVGIDPSELEEIDAGGRFVEH